MSYFRELLQFTELFRKYLNVRFLSSPRRTDPWKSHGKAEKSFPSDPILFLHLWKFQACHWDLEGSLDTNMAFHAGLVPLLVGYCISLEKE